MFLLALGILVWTTSAMAGPPTVGPETTYYQAPLDDEGYVDYVAALNAAFGDADAPPQDNAFLGILDQVNACNWVDGHVSALYTALNVEPPADDRTRFVTFHEYAEALDLPQAPPFDRGNAEPYGQSPPLGTIDALADRSASAPWTDADLPEVARWLGKINTPLDAIVASTRRPAYYAPLVRPQPDATVMEVLLPHLGMHRGVARSLDLRVRWRLGRGDFDAAITDWAAMKRLGRLQQREPVLISNLVGISIQALSHDAFNLIVSQSGITRIHLEQMRRVLDELPEGVSMAEVVQRAERVGVLDLFTQVSRGRVQMRDMIGNMQSTTLRDEPATFFVNNQGPDPLTALISDPNFDLDRVLRRINTSWDQWFGEIPANYPELVARQKQVDAIIEKTANQSRQNMPSLMAMSQNGIPDAADHAQIPDAADHAQIADATADLMLGILTPSLISAITTERQSQAQAALESVALALAAYRIDQGTYPPRLQSLVPDYLEAMPTDLLDRKPLRYRRQADGYHLYSVGTNLIDDGGVQDFREGDIVFTVPWSTSE